MLMRQQFPRLIDMIENSKTLTWKPLMQILSRKQAIAIKSSNSMIPMLNGKDNKETDYKNLYLSILNTKLSLGRVF